MKKSLFICAFMALTMAMGACSDNKKNSGDEEPCQDESCKQEKPEVSFVITRDMNSQEGCSLDADCMEGAFCFNNQCVVQCNQELGLNCGSGYYCQASRGRCVSQSYLEGLQSVTDEIEAAGDSLKEEEKNAKLAAFELKAKREGMTDVVYSVLGQKNEDNTTVEKVRIQSTVPYTSIVTEDTKTLNITAADSIGKVQYAVKVEGMGLPVLKTAKSIKKTDGTYQYDFDIDVKAIKLHKRNKSLLRQNSTSDLEPTNYEIISSAGSYAGTLIKPVEAKGYYTGNVRPDTILSGSPLPIRMYLDVEPTNPENFDAITKIKIYLPSSGADIFSPLASVDAKGNEIGERWSVVEMAKESDPKKCLSQTKCYVAKFSSNEFAIQNSRLITPGHKLNRAMRIEFSDYEPTSLTFYGVLKDDMTGFYRESAIEDGVLKRSWNISEMQGEFNVTIAGWFDDDIAKKAKSHTPESQKIRDVKDAPIQICTNQTTKKLLKYADNRRKELYGGSCEGITEADLKAQCEADKSKFDKCKKDYEDLKDDERWFCVQNSVEGIIHDNTRLSAVLESVLVADTESGNTDKTVEISCDNGTKEIHNFKDFMEVCGMKECHICDERPELVCGADLLARKFLDNELETIDEKATVMSEWISIMRESYLAQEYIAWNNDTEIRKSWLKGAVYDGTFASSVMNKFNNDLLARYNKEVLGVQHDIMGKQFMQTALEMLAQTVMSVKEADKVTKVSSYRNTILSELSQTWQSVAEGLGLSARRHDVLTQDDSARLAAAGELRMTLFDLYFAGLIESKINLGADAASLNAGYGSNLVSTINKITSLDQPFESLVFMRDGEIFRDTRVVTNLTDTALGSLQKAAEKSVANAEKRRGEIFDRMDAEALEAAKNKDNYLTALEDLRSQIVNLCGYPADCDTVEKQKNCKIFTDVYACGFSLQSKDSITYSDAAGNQIDIENTLDTKTDLNDDNNTPGKRKSGIKMALDYSKCFKVKEKTDGTGTETTVAIEDPICAGGLKMTNNQFEVTQVGSNQSKAALAILDYRAAVLDYETAVTEYEIHAQKVANNFETLDAYAQNIANWNEERKTHVENIHNKLKDIAQYQNNIMALNDEISKLELKEMEEEYTLTSGAYSNWATVASINMVAQNAAAAVIHASNLKGIQVNTAIDNADSDLQRDMLKAIMYNTTPRNDHSIGVMLDPSGNIDAAAAKAAAKKAYTDAAKSDGAKAELQKQKVQLETAAEAADFAAQMAEINFEFGIDQMDRQLEKDIAEKQYNLAVAISNLGLDDEGKIVEKGGHDESYYQDLINKLESDVEWLKEDYARKDAYERDKQNFEFMRNEFRNTALDLFKLLQDVKVKEMAVYRAKINYLTIALEAELLADQFNNKMQRYQEISNIEFSASKYFQHASDLELAETYIESARNDLSDYLTAVEYLTVRPYVDLRRSIYTARGTNDLVLLKEQIDDLTLRCGSGNESDNTVTISMRNRMGIADDVVDGLTPADRFHSILAAGNLPISAQTRYSVDGKIGDMLKKGEYYSGSFSLNKSFANIAGSCNAKISDIRIRFVSKSGQPIRPKGDAAPAVTLFYGGQSQLLSCHSNIEAITKSIGNRTTFGKYSTFNTDPFGDSVNVSLFNVPEGEDYQLESMPDFSNVTNYKGLNGYPLMATYTIVFDPNYGENKDIEWDNVADIEVQFSYTTGTLSQNSDKCQYDIL
ncbi:MAG: hypothetical protein J6A01_04020 [Proteobacteria bacterium]|nr:hypothetical protein [Pseudomonadota bacterium]